MFRGQNSVTETALSYVGTVVGAGFASGQEIAQFFGRSEPKSLWGILLATLLFALCGELILNLSARGRATHYGEFLREVCGRSLGKFYDTGSFVFFSGVLLVMMSGSGALWREIFGFTYLLGVLALTGPVLISLTFGTRGVAKLNLIVVPFLILFIVALCTLALGGWQGLRSEFDTGLRASEAIGFSGRWWFQAFIFVGNNLLLSSAVLFSLARGKDRAAVRGSGILGGFLLGLLALPVYLVTASGRYPLGEVPLYAAASSLGWGGEWIYSSALWLALLTTSVGAAQGLVGRLQASGGRGWVWLALTIALLSLAATRGFPTLVRQVYGSFGVLSLPFLAMLVLKGFRVKSGGKIGGTLWRGNTREPLAGGLEVTVRE
ncbi:MAG: hypothetical protein HYY09_05815 [Firmicutes bacterium]|nr:hypothetical protein [Bacillota bacterium]